MRAIQGIRTRLQPTGQHSQYMLSYLQQSIVRELTRAGRKDDSERMFREAIDAARAPQQIVNAMEFAAYRGDRQAAMSLFDRFAQEDLQKNDNRSLTWLNLRQNLNQSLGTVIGSQKVEPAEAMQLADRFLAYHIARTIQQRG